METPQQGQALFTGISLLIGVIVVIQLWILSAALDAAFTSQQGILWPAFGASLGLFILNGLLLMYVLDFDRRLRRTRRE